MSRPPSWTLRGAWALLCLQLLSACGGGGGGSPAQDTTPPTTRATPRGGSFDSATTVALACDDGSGSGCAATHYTLDGSTPDTGSPTYSEPLTLTASTTLRFFSVDKAGNTEASKQEQYSITPGGRDTVAPTTVAAPAGGVFNSPRGVTLQCTDDGSGCAATYFTQDGSTPTAQSSRYTAPLAITASTTLRFFSVDKAGNTEAVRTEQYVLDTGAPTVSASPKGGTFTSARTVTLTCADGDGAGCGAIHFTTDGSLPTAASPTYAEPLTVATSTRLRFFAVDLAGNASSVAEESYVIDSGPPTTTASPAGGAFREPVTVALTCVDEGSDSCAATHYTLDGTEPSTASPRYSSPVRLTANTTLRFFSVDTAGNAEAPKTESYVFDSTAPTTTASPSGGSFKVAQTVTLSCVDGGGGACAGTHYTLDGSPPDTSSPRYTAPLELTTSTVLKFFSVDGAGNREAVKEERYVIDSTPPTVSASPKGGAFQNLPTVTLTCDDGAGNAPCTAIHYTLDDTPPGTGSQTYTAPLTLSATTVVRFIGVDALGNVSAEGTETYTLDRAAPFSSVNPPGRLYRRAQDVSLYCADDVACAATYYTLDGSTPTTSSTKYTQELRVTEDTTLKFFSVDTAGNVEAVQTEVYTFDRTPPTTTASPASGTYAYPLSVTLTCDDGLGSGCYVTYYTTDGSDPSSSGGAQKYTGPVTLWSSGQLRFVSYDLLGNEERPVTQTYDLSVTPADVSGDIAAVRASPDATGVSLPIRGARVTYTKPLVGNAINDPAGFFLQAQAAGPALFVAVDPTTLTPPLAVGDIVKLNVTGKSTVNGMARAVSISDVLVLSRNQSVAQLVQYVSNVDLPPAAADYEAELINLEGTINGEFSAAGAGFVQAPMTTFGTPWNSPSAANLRFRLLSSLPEQLLLEPGCTVTLESPLWTFRTGTSPTTATQPSLWSAQDLKSSYCPQPRLLSAWAPDPGSLVLRFDRRIDPASVASHGGQFTLSGGLIATYATVVGREVRLVTSLQGRGDSYTVTVADSVRDRRGQPVNSAANSTSFVGHVEPAVLRITEIAPNLLNGRDVIELQVIQGGNTDSMTLVDGTSTLATLPGVLVSTGDLIVVHLTSGGPTPDGEAWASETLSKSEFSSTWYPSNYDTAWDFLGVVANIAFPGNHVFGVKDPNGALQDALPVTSPGNTFAAFPAQLQYAQDYGHWLPSSCFGVPCTYTSVPSAWDVSVNWGGLGTFPTDRSMTLGRVTYGDSDANYDWAIGPGTFGFVNP